MHTRRMKERVAWIETWLKTHDMLSKGKVMHCPFPCSSPTASRTIGVFNVQNPNVLKYDFKIQVWRKI